MNATISPAPKNFEEWLKTAPLEELVRGFYERLTETNKEIAELKTQIIALIAENKSLKMGIIAHKHADSGESTIPTGAVFLLDK